MESIKEFLGQLPTSLAVEPWKSPSTLSHGGFLFQVQEFWAESRKKSLHTLRGERTALQALEKSLGKQLADWFQRFRRTFLRQATQALKAIEQIDTPGGVFPNSRFQKQVSLQFGGEAFRLGSERDVELFREEGGAAVLKPQHPLRVAIDAMLEHRAQQLESLVTSPLDRPAWQAIGNTTNVFGSNVGTQAWVPNVPSQAGLWDLSDPTLTPWKDGRQFLKREVHPQQPSEDVVTIFPSSSHIYMSALDSVWKLLIHKTDRPPLADIAAFHRRQAESPWVAAHVMEGLLATRWEPGTESSRDTDIWAWFCQMGNSVSIWWDDATESESEGATGASAAWHEALGSRDAQIFGRFLREGARPAEHWSIPYALMLRFCLQRLSTYQPEPKNRDPKGPSRGKRDRAGKIEALINYFDDDRDRCFHPTSRIAADLTADGTKISPQSVRSIIAGILNESIVDGRLAPHVSRRVEQQKLRKLSKQEHRGQAPNNW